MDTGTFIKTRLTKMKVALSGLENLLLLLVAVVTILGVVAVSSRIKRDHIQSLLTPKPAQPASSHASPQHP